MKQSILYSNVEGNFEEIQFMIWVKYGLSGVEGEWRLQNHIPAFPSIFNKFVSL